MQGIKKIVNNYKGEHWFLKGIANGDILVENAIAKIDEDGNLTWEDGIWLSGRIWKNKKYIKYTISSIKGE